ncbi:Zinc finger and SCAN domain-containing protein 29 [Chelonia mydas]|uniref:Zinc finger and SCAN domain-containing protein 29 n=1 Tax=Chelonia mydas TaxID=8469 RepID=M7BME1_CHEMY|nr:Zinc finger and SCAN domain-containing protein 29 [Chelonia mydas]
MKKLKMPGKVPAMGEICLILGPIAYILRRTPASSELLAIVLIEREMDWIRANVNLLQDWLKALALVRDLSSEDPGTEGAGDCCVLSLEVVGSPCCAGSLSASFQVAIPAPCTRRSPAWSNAELLDLIGIWGEEAVQSQLRSSRRNYDTYGQISRRMTERGHDRDTLQCRVKMKELRNAYHKVREANCRSGAAPTSCHFYKELDAILGVDPTSTVKAPVDTSLACMTVESGPSQEEEILDE